MQIICRSGRFGRAAHAAHVGARWRARMRGSRLISPVAGTRTPRRADRQGERGRDPRLRRESASAADAAARSAAQVTLGVDPGFRTGCKLAVVDETGQGARKRASGYFTLPESRSAEAAGESADSGHDPPPQGHRYRHRQRHGLPRERTVHRVAAAGSAGRGLTCIVSEAGASRLFGFQAGGEGISGVRRFAHAARFPSRGACRTRWPNW